MAIYNFTDRYCLTTKLQIWHMVIRKVAINTQPAKVPRSSIRQKLNHNVSAGKLDFNP